MHQDVASILGAESMQKVCDFTDAERAAAQKEIDIDKAKRLEDQADMGKFLLLLGFGMLYFFWAGYDVRVRRGLCRADASSQVASLRRSCLGSSTTARRRWASTASCAPQSLGRSQDTSGRPRCSPRWLGACAGYVRSQPGAPRAAAPVA